MKIKKFFLTQMRKISCTTFDKKKYKPVCGVQYETFFGVCFGLQKKINQRTTFFYFLAFYWKYFCVLLEFYLILHRKTAREL